MHSTHSVPSTQAVRGKGRRRQLTLSAGSEAVAHTVPGRVQSVTVLPPTLWLPCPAAMGQGLSPMTPMEPSEPGQNGCPQIKKLCRRGSRDSTDTAIIQMGFTVAGEGPFWLGKGKDHTFYFPSDFWAILK